MGGKHMVNWNEVETHGTWKCPSCSNNLYTAKYRFEIPTHTLAIQLEHPIHLNPLCSTFQKERSYPSSISAAPYQIKKQCRSLSLRSQFILVNLILIHVFLVFAVVVAAP